MRIAAATLLLVLAVLGLSCSSRGGSEDVTPLPTLPPVSPLEAGIAPGRGTILATDNRERLSFCLNRVPEGDPHVEDVDKLREAIAKAHAFLEVGHVVRRYLEPNNVTPGGCPAPSVPVEVQAPTPGDKFGHPVRVETPSEHRVFVYLLPEEDYAVTFADQPYYETSAEMLCSGDQCWEVTTAIYAPSSLKENVLAEAVLDAVGAVY